MNKKLVAYFSASGVTAKVAGMLAEALDADIHEIKPKVPYTKADLNWMNKKSRSSVEMSNKALRPEMAASDVRIDQYDVIFRVSPFGGMLPLPLSTPSWRAPIFPARRSFSLQPPAAASLVRPWRS